MIEYATNENGQTELIPIPGQIENTYMVRLPDWSKAENIPLANLNGYVCPSDGYIVGNIAAVTNSTFYMYINGVYVAKSQDGSNGLDIDPSLMITVAKGDKVTTSGSLTSNDYSKLSFVPMRSGS